LYGAGCYRPGGCADIIQAVAERIDARQFNPLFPQPFPRFIQHAIWRYYSQSGLDVCNGNRIMMRVAAPRWIAGSGSCVIAWCCARLSKATQ
jgi:hypothetical protein